MKVITLSLSPFTLQVHARYTIEREYLHMAGTYVYVVRFGTDWIATANTREQAMAKKDADMFQRETVQS